jgi:hypothetical protein
MQDYEKLYKCSEYFGALEKIIKADLKTTKYHIEVLDLIQVHAETKLLYKKVQKIATCITSL